MQPKYFLSLGACFKNESHILEEWINHYLQEGVEHFYLINNNSTDNFMPIIEKYKSFITYFEDKRDHQQRNYYNDNILPLKNETEWLMIVDLDEFIYSRHEFPTIASYLRTLSPEVSQVRVPWKIFGSNGHIKQPPSVIEGFTKRAFFNPIGRIHVKSIIRTDKTLEIGVHTHNIVGTIIDSNGSIIRYSSPNFDFADISEEILQNSKLHLNHYIIQSYEFFMSVKVTRGDIHFTHNCRNENYFRERDEYGNRVEDTELRDKRRKDLNKILS
jgi:hypothetical protein